MCVFWIGVNEVIFVELFEIVVVNVFCYGWYMVDVWCGNYGW